MRLLVVDDHEIVREGLRAALTQDTDLEIVGEAGSGQEALQVLRRTLPDTVLTDFRLPDTTGDVLCRQIAAVSPSTAVVVLTTYLSEEIVRQVAEAGAHGFVTKAAGLGALRSALREAGDGSPSRLRHDCAAAFVRDLDSPAVAGDAAAVVLTAQQRAVLELAVEGLTYAQIGARLFISESTVRFHVQRIKERLGAGSKAELIATAIRSALVVPGPEARDG